MRHVGFFPLAHEFQAVVGRGCEEVIRLAEDGRITLGLPVFSVAGTMFLLSGFIRVKLVVRLDRLVEGGS